MGDVPEVDSWILPSAIALLLGAGLSVLLTPAVGIWCFAICGGLVAVTIARRWLIRTSSSEWWLAIGVIFLAVAGPTGMVFNSMLRDVVPPVSYSLIEVTSLDVPGYLPLGHPPPRGAVLYRFSMRNPGRIDLQDVHAALSLPNLLVEDPFVIRSSQTDGLVVRPELPIVTLSSSRRTDRLPGYSSGVVVEMNRLKPSGLVEVGVLARPPPGFVCSARDPTDGKLDGRYGDLFTRRRHA